MAQRGRGGRSAAAALIPALVRCLRTGAPVQRDQAALRIGALMLNAAASDQAEPVAAAIAAAGGIAPLVQLLSSSASAAVQAAAAAALRGTAFMSPARCRAILEAWVGPASVWVRVVAGRR